MRVPQVSERIKEAPAQALRGVFAGIGQLLLYTDKLRNKTPFGQQVPDARVPGPSQAAAPRTVPAEPGPDSAAAGAAADREVAAEPIAGQAPRTPRTPKTPRISRAPRTPRIPAAPKTPTTPAAAAEVRDFDKTGNVRLLTGDEGRADDEPPAGGPADSSPPLSNYDELSIASLRARLRNLDVTQVRVLADYERAHAARADVIVMFERRIAKLEAGD